MAKLSGKEIQKLARSIVTENPGGIRYSVLVEKISEQNPEDIWLILPFGVGLDYWGATFEGRLYARACHRRESSPPRSAAT